MFFSDFIKIVLDFQLNEHVEFLNHFTKVYRIVDSKQQGYLDEEKFRLLIFKMIEACCEHLADIGSSPELTTIDENEVNKEIKNMMRYIDFTRQLKLNFSEIVQILTAYKVDSIDGSGTKVPFLEKFVSVLTLTLPPPIEMSVTLQSILLTNISMELPEERNNSRSKSRGYRHRSREASHALKTKTSIEERSQ